MPIVRVKFEPELGLAPPGWRSVFCRKVVTETSKAGNPMYTIHLAADGFRPFRTWLMLPAEAQPAYAYNKRLSDINSALAAFEVPPNADGVLPWPGITSKSWAFVPDDFVERAAKLWLGVKPAEKGYAASNTVDWQRRS